MKEKNEKVLVLVRADEESRRFLELAYNAAALTRTITFYFFCFMQYSLLAVLSSAILL